MSTYNLCFEQKYEKYQEVFSENFQFLEVKFSIYLNRLVFVMSIATASICLRNLVALKPRTKQQQ